MSSSVSVDELSAIGGRIQFTAQRIAYLRQHPDAQAGQSFVWNSEAANAISLVTGALVDLIADACGGAALTPDVFSSRLTDSGIRIQLTVAREPDSGRSGFQLVKSLASAISFDSVSKQLTIEASGRSVQAGFPEPPEGCPPVVAR
jgi:hypothetical protein